MEKVVFQLEPLTCPSCVNKIESRLLEIDGVHFSKVLYNTSKVTSAFDDTLISVDELKMNIEQLGYTVQNTKTT